MDTKWYDEAGNVQHSTKIGHFQRIKIHNAAADPSGDGSIARQLSARIELRDGDQLMECWMGRWPDLPEAEDLGQKWELDRIDLPPNGQEAILDIGVSYEGEPGFFRWDNSRFIGEYNAPRHHGECYEIRVVLGATNMSKMELRFELSNALGNVRLIPLQRHWRGWIKPG